MARLARLIVALVGCAATASVVGCATYADRLAKVRDEFVTGNLAGAESAIDDGMRHRADRDVLQLDKSIVQLCSGKPLEAERSLREMRDRFDEREGALAHGQALSMLSDAQAKTYAGEDYEKVLIRAFLCLANLMGDGGDALAYSLQVTEKQQRIIETGADKNGENPKAGYQHVALGPYLHGAVRERSHADYDDLERACVAVCSWQPEFAYGAQDLERARTGRHSAPGNGVVYVVALVGVGPHKEEVEEIPSTVSLLIADRILSAVGDQTLPPTIAPVKVPKLVVTPHEVGSVGVAVDGRPQGATSTITDIGRMAVAQHEAVYPRIVAEAIVRRIVKKGVIYGTKTALGVDKHSWESLLFDVAGVVWEATESADTRCWGLLPDKIQVLRIELPAGRHALTLQSLGASGYPLGRPATREIEVVDGRSTFVLANFPYGNLVGAIQANTP